MTTKEWLERYNASGFWGGGRGPWAKECGLLLKAREKNGTPGEPPESNSSATPWL